MSDVAVPVKTDSAGQWWVQVRGKAYGPYSMEQLAGFVAEGRIRPATQVSQKPDGDWTEARGVTGLMAPLRSNVAANDTPAEAANVFVHAEIVSGSWMAFMAALESMGAVCDLAPGLWLVRTKFSAGIIRNTLANARARRPLRRDRRHARPLGLVQSWPRSRRAHLESVERRAARRSALTRTRTREATLRAMLPLIAAICCNCPFTRRAHAAVWPHQRVTKLNAMVLQLGWAEQ
ncbi:MAG: DUF4339 domain-containing protein [Hyphomonadaceae bacterium]